MKKFLTLQLALFFTLVVNSQSLQLPFIDNFEETISNDAVFTNWTTENLEGWNYWHIIPWGGDGGGQCMRFENTTINQNDWLITKQITTDATKNLIISFSHKYTVAGVKPKLLHTTNYNGTAAQCNWNEIEYSLGANSGIWYNSGNITIENSGTKIWFAFHYEAAANEGIYLLLDNFKVTGSNTADYTKVGSSEHFEFYTNIENQENFYTDLLNDLEYRYEMYKSLWERPLSNTIYPELEKLKVIYTLKSGFPASDNTSPEWDCGTFSFENGEIYISPLDNADKQNYYGTLGKLAINELSQLAVTGWLDRDLARWYSEGFGLYEMGYRPNRQQLLDKLTQLNTQEPALSALEDISDLNLAGKKDLMTSFFQSKLILQCYFLGFWNDDTYKWWQLLKHYYIKDTDRIELLHSSQNFDIYGASKELSYAEPIATDMEAELVKQGNRFGNLMKHRASICIYDVEVGKEINNRTDFQGLACGADKINTMHLDIGDYGLMHHEFMHMWVNMMCPVEFIGTNQMLPGQFLNEGLAESTDRFMPDAELPAHNYKIVGLYDHYRRKYNREPTWLEIVNNAEVNVEDGFWVDAYAIGEMYWRYMNDKYPDNFWSKVKEFLQNKRDWTVFAGKTTEQEGAEFIQFMKELAFVGPPLESTDIPYFTNFNNTFKGWTTMHLGINHTWQLLDNDGYDDSYCAYAVDPYWIPNEDAKNVDGWLVSPPLNVSNIVKIKIQFMYKQTGNASKPKMYYTGEFSGPLGNTNWTPVENLNWVAPEGEWRKMEFEIANPPEKLFIAIRFESNTGDYYSYCIDNFNVGNFNTGLNELFVSESDFSIYPNPVTSESAIYFNNRTTTKVNLVIYNAQGQKITSFLNDKMIIGENKISVGKLLLSKGVYFCKLESDKIILTQKFIVE